MKKPTLLVLNGSLFLVLAILISIFPSQTLAAAKKASLPKVDKTIAKTILKKPSKSDKKREALKVKVKDTKAKKKAKVQEARIAKIAEDKKDAEGGEALVLNERKQSKRQNSKNH